MPDVYEEVGERVRGEVLSSKELKEVYNNKNIAKSITFIYTDKGEYYNVKPIGDEAVKEDIQLNIQKILKKKQKLEYTASMCVTQRIPGFQ